MFGLVRKLQLMLSAPFTSDVSTKAIHALAARAGYDNVILRIKQIQVFPQEGCLAFVVVADPTWPNKDPRYAGMLIRAWIANYLVWVAAKQWGLHCAIEQSGERRFTTIDDVKVDIPCWTLWDSQGSIGPIQVLYTYNEEEKCVYIQIGAVMLSRDTFSDPHYFRLLGRLGEAFKKYCPQFSLVEGVPVVGW